MNETWPWLALAGLGAFHGVNPAMGWLFAVALGLHRKSRRVVLLALIPIAIGHALAIAAVVAAVIVLGTVVDTATVSRAAGVLLIAWAVYHSRYGHRHRVRFGMGVGLLGLGAWSFLMATAHGAGLMLIPVLAPMGAIPEGHHHELVTASTESAAAAVVVHSTAMWLVTGAVAVAVYEWVGVGVLRRGWINLDILWTLALLAAGIILLV